MKDLKIKFKLDGSGVMMDPAEPVHLDSLVAWTLCRLKGMPQTDGSRDAPIQDMELPLASAVVGGRRLWMASALAPEGGDGETTRCWRKKFRVSRIEATRGSPNLQNGTYKEWNQKVVLTLCPCLVGYLRAYSLRDIHRLLKKVRYIGKKASQGLGRVVDVEVEECGEERSLVWEGRAMRFLPAADGWKLVRTRPPYWNSNDRVMCIVPGDDASQVVVSGKQQ